MTTNRIYVEIFGKRYPLTDEQAKKSNFLKNAFGFTGFKKTKVAKLDFADDVKPAFEYIYESIRKGIIVEDIPKNNIYDIIVLEGYLDVPIVHETIKKYLTKSSFPVDFYTNLYTAKYLYPKDLLNILENKILNQALNADDVPEKLINKVGIKNVMNALIEKSNTLKSELQKTNTALNMRIPTYWYRFRAVGESILLDYTEKINEKMSSFIELDDFLKEAEKSGKYLKVEALAKLEENHETSILSAEQSAKLFRFLIKHKLVNALKNIDEMKIEMIEEYISKELMVEYEKLINP